MSYIQGLRRMSERPENKVQSDPSFKKLLGHAENWERERDKYKKALEEIVNSKMSKDSIELLGEKYKDLCFHNLRQIAKEALKNG